MPYQLHSIQHNHAYATLLLHCICYSAQLRFTFCAAQVFERLPEPPAPDDLSVWGNFEQASERLYMIGLNGRGQAVLRNLGVMDCIDTASSLVLGRLDWQPNSAPDSPKPTYYTTRTYKTRCLQRDRLASCLLQELREKHAGAVSVTFGARCVQAEWKRDGSSGHEVRRDRPG
jgi:2-polyprenyl-6-methoxyphenol hydroxylase-like FAD-dependent oxidoreductase